MAGSDLRYSNLFISIFVKLYIKKIERIFAKNFARNYEKYTALTVILKLSRLFHHPWNDRKWMGTQMKCNHNYILALLWELLVRDFWLLRPIIANSLWAPLVVIVVPYQRFVSSIRNIEIVMWVFQLTRLVLAVLKISSILIKYLCYFWEQFSYFHGQNKYKIRLSAHCIALPKKLINLKVKKIWV